MKGKLARQTERAEELSILQGIAATVSESQELREILSSTLDRVLKLTGLEAGWIVLLADHGEGLEPAASRGWPSEARAAGLWSPWKRCICEATIGLTRFNAGQDVLDSLCTANQSARTTGPFVQVCVPLRSKDRVVGAMALTGDSSDVAPIRSPYISELLSIIGQHLGLAVENVLLYEELRQKEALRRQLLHRVITVQEEERRRIARELHDETSQALASLIVRFQVLEEARSLADIQGCLDDLRAETARALDKVHEMALRLRPRVLDDLGLVAALRHYVRDYEGRFCIPVDFQVLGLGSERLPSDVETALYRIVQEALINVASHAQARSVNIVLEKRWSSAVVVVEDDGRGFDAERTLGSRLQDHNLGLHGMQERAGLLGGVVTIESSPRTGTSVFAEIPLEGGDSIDAEDSSPPG